MRVLLTGAGGQLGRALSASVPAGITLLPFTSTALDLRDVTAVRDICARERPDLLVNAAAYTQVDRAESEPEQAMAVNATGVANLVAATAPTTRLLHVSTDFVFDGSGQQPYPPEHPTAPLGVYGRSKLAGEQVLQAQAPERSCIVRTAWLYDAEGRNFVNTMLALQASREQLQVVADQRGTPTSADSLARALWRLAALPTVTGILHWTDAGETSWHGFACEIQRQALALGLLECRIPIEPVPTSVYPTPARRPAYSVLDKTATWATLGLQSAPWEEELERILRQKVR